MSEGVKKVQERARGFEPIIAPVGCTWNEFFLNGPKVSDDFLAERATQEQADCSVEPGRIVIETETGSTLEHMLAAFDPKRHGGEAMAGSALGEEAFALGDA